MRSITLSGFGHALATIRRPRLAILSVGGLERPRANGSGRDWVGSKRLLSAGGKARHHRRRRRNAVKIQRRRSMPDSELGARSAPALRWRPALGTARAAARASQAPPVFFSVRTALRPLSSACTGGGCSWLPWPRSCAPPRRHGRGLRRLEADDGVRIAAGHQLVQRDRHR